VSTILQHFYACVNCCYFQTPKPTEVSKNVEKLENYAKLLENSLFMTSDCFENSLQKTVHYATLLMSHQGGTPPLVGGETLI